MYPNLLRKFLGIFVAVLSANCFAAGEEKPVFGPFDAPCSGTGPGHVLWFDGAPPIDGGSAWSISCWIHPARVPQGRVLIAGFGDGVNLTLASATELTGQGSTDRYKGFPGTNRYLGAGPQGVFFWTGRQVIEGKTPIQQDRWQHLAVTYDGKNLRLYHSGREILSRDIPLAMAAAQVLIAPPSPSWKDANKTAGKPKGGKGSKGNEAKGSETNSSFEGSVAHFAVWNQCLPGAEVFRLANQSVALPMLSRIPAPAGPTPGNRSVIFKGCMGMLAPQPAQTLPKPAPTWSANRKPKLSPRPVSQINPNGDLVLNQGWELIDATGLGATGAAVCSPSCDTRNWYDATVPGTVLTTLVQQGIYPDPLYGLNNRVIPDTLWRHNWWYRVEFPTPANWESNHLALNFNGINYHADIWLNGKQLGQTNGAFIRGRFDVTGQLRKDGMNVLAVHVWGPPHGGWAHEESHKAGTGDNGGQGVLDGPSFFCTEGWDWIPGIRDRCTGIWQDVVLHSTGPVTIGDPQVITSLPKLPDLSHANVTVKIELRNLSEIQQKVILKGSLHQVDFQVPATLSPGETRIVAAPLVIANPRLWWPNGYGEANLHDLKLSVVSDDGKISDTKSQRIGLRTISYDTKPSLTIKINGRKIFCKGGNWGMDDAMKVVTREHLEPYFRLHRDANTNMIRNWCGQNTEEIFYQLADEYGILVWNDFWQSTGGYNLEPINAELFLANAADVVKQYRNHPCIAIWCGRNEGTPPDWINKPLAELLKKHDGTRRYEPCSNSRDGANYLQRSGPYKYQNPVEFFTKYSSAFAVEMGVNSVPEADAIRAMMPANQTWPVSDAWVYHDLHVDGNGDWKVYANAIREHYGNFNSLEEFCRKAQMLNYDYHRTMFEGFNSKLWNPCGGLMIWMSHPAWPSTVWQFYTHDYDTHGAYYGVKKACEPVHVQWNLNDNDIAIINNRSQTLTHATVTATIYSLAGRQLKKYEKTLDAAPQAATNVFKLPWPIEKDSPVHFLKLELRDSGGALLSDNFYWHAATPADQRQLQRMKAVKLAGSVAAANDEKQTKLTLQLSNPSNQIALMTRLTLRDAKTNQRILPAYYSDNYVSFLPGEKKTITIECLRTNAPLKTTLDGWNITSTEVQSSD